MNHKNICTRMTAAAPNSIILSFVFVTVRTCFVQKEIQRKLEVLYQSVQLFIISYIPSFFQIQSHWLFSQLLLVIYNSQEIKKKNSREKKTPALLLLYIKGDCPYSCIIAFQEAELRRMQEMLEQMQRQMQLQAATTTSTTSTAQCTRNAQVYMYILALL